MELKVTGSRHHGMQAMMSDEDTQYFDSFEEFMDEWYFQGERFHQLNHCIGYDIVHPVGDDYEDITDKYNLILHMMLQRKALYVPVIIQDIKEEELPAIESFLNECWHFMKKQWREVIDVLEDLPSLDEQIDEMNVMLKAMENQLTIEHEQAEPIILNSEPPDEEEDEEDDEPSPHAGKTMKLVCNCGNELLFKPDKDSKEVEDDYGLYRKTEGKIETWSGHDEAGFECKKCGLTIWYFA